MLRTSTTLVPSLRHELDAKLPHKDFRMRSRFRTNASQRVPRSNLFPRSERPSHQERGHNLGTGR